MKGVWVEGLCRWKGVDERGGKVGGVCRWV